MKAPIVAGFIIFLFYSNLLMGEFTRSDRGTEKIFIFAMSDIFKAANFVIAVISALAGHMIFEHFRRKI